MSCAIDQNVGDIGALILGRSTSVARFNPALVALAWTPTAVPPRRVSLPGTLVQDGCSVADGFFLAAGAQNHEVCRARLLIAIVRK